MDSTSPETALSFLQNLVDQPLSYGLKSSDTDLYDFGFGEQTNVVNRRGEVQKRCTHIIHIICRFKVIWKNKKHSADNYYEDTPCEVFHSNIQNLIGLKVKRISLSEKNDLWLDFGECWIVFATFENGEESWRYFTLGERSKHLIASDVWLDLQI